VQRYREWLMHQPALLGALDELRGKRLGCWCKLRGDEACHGDVLAELADKRRDIVQHSDAAHDDRAKRKLETADTDSSSAKRTAVSHCHHDE
jgi:hypothetical protein